jgi:putative heme-binding domain-containing protein
MFPLSAESLLMASLHLSLVCPCRDWAAVLAAIPSYGCLPGKRRWIPIGAWFIAIAMLCADAKAEDPPLSSTAFLHLDAATLGHVSKDGNNKPLASGERVDRWPDGSGHQPDFVATGNARPTFHTNGEASSVRFDGVENAMRMISDVASLDQVTLFLMIAPHSNPGDFRGLLATNAPNEKDYSSGLNVDLGPGPSRSWTALNIEGKGFSGAKNLSQSDFPFRTPHLVEVRIDRVSRSVTLLLDGKYQAARPMDNVSFSTAEWTLGARFYTHGPGDQQARGHAALDLSEVIVWDRLLTSSESEQIREYLANKHSKLAAMLSEELSLGSSLPLVKVENPPAIQMLQPGFSVRSLPVEITNVNNVVVRHDGTLVTLGYNGDIHLLRDTDGDGLEDEANVFYKNTGALRGPIGMQWTTRGDSRGNGAFVASKGKISFIKDNDGDDRADEEVIVAKGWEEIAQNVDAVGLALGDDGSIYFGLGTANYANAYLVDDSGKAAYDLKSDRGTIQRISPDFSERETICTGVRFPIGIAFNVDGELFCTDQEGATWLPNGNPFDELLHIQRSKHYGFPPRHPRHNPAVLDEPSVFDYGPQHQSTCGLFFNRGPADPHRFGPKAWGDNAIVCGESRGKLWRTQLVSTPDGYVAQSQLIACLQMLTVDSCVTPDGQLVVACHSGPPDWGTGPAGIGSLFKIQAAPENVARPIQVWSASPTEFRIAFDQPLNTALWRELSSQIRVEAGSYVRAGDRLETLTPPYAVVQAQSLSPRRNVPVIGVGVTADLRTLLIQVPAQTRDESYAITLPGVVDAKPSDPNDVPQMAEIDVDLALNGVLATWTPDSNASDKTQIWLPHIDLGVAQRLTAHSASHEAFWKQIQAAGILELETQIDLRNVLRPKIQPGAAIDYTWPDEVVSLRWTPMHSESEWLLQELLINDETHTLSAIGNKDRAQLFEQPPVNGTGPLEPIRLRIHTQPGSLPTQDSVLTLQTNEDPTPRAIPLHRFRLPWARDAKAIEPETTPIIAEIEGGNWGRGHRLFHRNEVGCSKCHTAPGSGIAPRIGPDLSNLMFRDYASVLRDIKNPSYAINPEFIGHQVRLEDGTVLTGVLREESGRLLLGDANGKSTELDRSQIEEMVPSQSSIMPNGLFDKLTADEIRDLMTYLLTSPPRMPIEGAVVAPKLRTVADVADVLAGSTPMSEPLKRLKIVLVAGPKDHGPGEHDYPAWLLQWGQLLTAADAVEIETAWEFPSAEQLQSADVLLFFQKGSWGPDRAQAMDAYFQRGGGAMYIHWAVNGDDEVTEFSRRIGLASWGGNIRYRHGPLDLKVEDRHHPIMRNVPDLDLLDESYWLLTGDPKQIGLLASSVEEGEMRPQLWTYEKGHGRVFVSIPGHYNWTFDDPIFRTILLRAMAWTAREPIDRFNDLVPLGARMAK